MTKGKKKRRKGGKKEKGKKKREREKKLCWAKKGKWKQQKDDFVVKILESFSNWAWEDF